MITYSDGSLPSARLLRDTIEELTGKHLIISNNPKKREVIHINYGANQPWIKCEDNAPAFISLCCGKYTFATLLEKNGFHVPHFQRGTPGVFPAVVRETLTGSGGVGIHVVKTAQEYTAANLSPSFWWTGRVTTHSEFRVHVLGGKIAKMSKKVYRDESQPEAEFPIRSHLRGYFFKLIKEDTIKDWSNLNELIAKLNTILTGSFYGLDIGWDTAKKEYFVFEANSAPGLNPITVRIYAQYLIDKLGLGGEHGGVHRAGEVTQ